jgi:hypothetical protein
MNTTREDDRTQEQKKTNKILITATDKFMSGWGGASGGASKCAWACREDQDWGKVLDWVEKRSDMKYVNVNHTGKWYPQAAHVHIYVCDDNHPAFR